MKLRDLYMTEFSARRTLKLAAAAKALPQITHEKRSERGLYNGNCSDARLQRSDREGLHNLLRRLGFHHDHLAEHLPLAGLGGGLHPRFDPAQTREGEDAALDNFFRRDLSKAADELRANIFLQFAFGGERLRQSALGHGLGRLHSLGSHFVWWKRRSYAKGGRSGVRRLSHRKRIEEKCVREAH